MRTIFYIVRKEFRQIFRNKSMLPIIFVMPIIQLIILSNAATFEIKNVNFNVLDLDKSQLSYKLINKFEASPYFTRLDGELSVNTAEEEILNDRAKLVIVIPQNFEKDLVRENKAEVQLLINAIDGSAAGIISSYAQNIITDFNIDARISMINLYNPEALPSTGISYRHWYNSELDYITFMVPGIMALLVTLIGLLLSAMSIVKEKEIGTIEQINVTPIRKHELIIGKLIPFFIIANFELAFGLAIGKIIFNIPIVGSIWLIFLFASLYLIVALSIGLIISTYTDTQQQAMFITWFIMVIFILMSGLFTPIQSMPMWAQRITWFNPVAYFIDVMRMVMLKGSAFADIQRHFIILSIYAVISTSYAVFRYKKVN